MGKRKPTPRTVEKRLFEETHHEYIIYREYIENFVSTRRLPRRSWHTGGDSGTR